MYFPLNYVNPLFMFLLKMGRLSLLLLRKIFFVSVQVHIAFLTTSQNY